MSTQHIADAYDAADGAVTQADYDGCIFKRFESFLSDPERGSSRLIREGIAEVPQEAQPGIKKLTMLAYAAGRTDMASECHRQHNNMLAASAAVAFAEDARFDARVAHLSNQISVDAYNEVDQAAARVRQIAARGIRAQETP